ncbi:MBL fold metallo-hydrolase [Bacillus sp. T33-2]|uniref:MBL fold metallo-hydrolase n=1 Tax=Bacillus sp. T33-2 TaxID=2054168 RepID=UPI000C779E01|nr:MBL fold metallo-hydrolase [Bacillus sp. T33-2]PLR97465.1 MBL fold metallo-hydrolase [Bacillus sp. T33-2]
MKMPVEIAENVFLIDDFDLQMEERTGTYVLNEEQLTLIETSASPSIPYVLKGLEALGFSPVQVNYIIVTHIHLDHSGGAGLMLKHCPNAKIVVHPKGARHLADPSRLVAGARAVYGDKFDELFDPVLPVPEDRIITKADRDTLEIGAGCTLSFYDTPGHANHHFSIHHMSLNGLFAGDTAGIYYPQLHRAGIELYLPSTSPNQFDPEKMLKSLALYKDLAVEKIFFGHFGMSVNTEEVYRQISWWLDVFVKESQSALLVAMDANEAIQETSTRLKEAVFDHLKEMGINESDPVFGLLALDLDVSSMGLIDYLSKKQSQ